MVASSGDLGPASTREFPSVYAPLLYIAFVGAGMMAGFWAKRLVDKRQVIPNKVNFLSMLNRFN
jgi:hypothetical protein